MSASSDSDAAVPAPFQSAAGPGPGERVLVGLSGGVDSAVAAARLVEAGCDVVGVTTRNFCASDLGFAPDAAARSCCSQEAIDAARELSAELGISHSVLDVAELFQAAVIDDFVAEYRNGRTPNPCVRCNARVRFPQLLGYARRLGFSWVATGHYSRVLQRDGQRYVARGRDQAKDQSYFLHRVSSDALEHVAFPLGHLTKEEVRREAEQRRLPVARTPDSQEVCFVPDGDRSHLLGNDDSPGDIVDQQGQVVGAHRGVAHYTPGQRRGLGVGGSENPVYVVALDAAARRVSVGPADALMRDVLHCDEFHWRDPEGGAPGLTVRTRYRHPGLPVRRITTADERCQIELRASDRAPAPGQAIVVYRGDVVVGGGRLVEASCAS